MEPQNPAIESVVQTAFATCPLCHHRDDMVTDDGVAAGADWRCGTCGQHWTAGRLATVAAYTAWVLARTPAVVARAS